MSENASENRTESAAQSETAEDKKIIGPVEIITIALAVVIIGFILMKQGGLNVMTRKDSTELIHTPGGHHWEESRHKYEAHEDDVVGSFLRKLAKQFHREQPIDIMYYQKKGFQKSELYFYEKLRAQYGHLDSESEWLILLKDAKQTYQKIDKFFFDVSGQPAETLGQDDVIRLIDDTRNDIHFFEKLNQYFNIDENEARAFTRYNPNTVSDWALFIHKQLNH